MVVAYLNGILRWRETTGLHAEKVIIEVGGVGFEVLVSRLTYAQLGEIGEATILHTCLSIRENEWTMFGFAVPEEKEMFTLLQSVTGVGPKMALSLVGTLSPQHIAEAIIDEDHKALCQAPGVGAKVAQRIILELKTKIAQRQAVQGVVPAASKTRASQEARAILEGLGYTITEINHAFKQVTDDSLKDDVELLVRNSIKILSSTKV